VSAHEYERDEEPVITRTVLRGPPGSASATYLALPGRQIYYVITMSTSNETQSPIPLYRRIRDELKARIEAGEYQPGDRLPSELELARAYGVSRITSRQALDLLGSEGLLVRRQGMGSFVTAQRVTQPLGRLTDFVEDMAEAGLRPESKVLGFATEPATVTVAEALRVLPETLVYRLDRLRLAEGSPIALDWTWLPPHFGKLLVDQDLAQRTIYNLLEQEYGIPVASGECTIGATVAGETEASVLDIPTGSPLLVFDRTSFTAGDKPVYYQERFYRADRVQYRLTLERTTPGESAIQSFTPVFGGRSEP
jgi:GntR family transcriptional regulator